MSKYERQFDGSEICPYCMSEYVPEEEIPPTQEVVECEECGKKYYREPEYSVDYQTTPDCELNGEQHNFELEDLSNGRQAYFCSICGKYNGRLKNE